MANYAICREFIQTALTQADAPRLAEQIYARQLEYADSTGYQFESCLALSCDNTANMAVFLVALARALPKADAEKLADSTKQVKTSWGVGDYYWPGWTLETSPGIRELTDEQRAE